MHVSSRPSIVIYPTFVVRSIGKTARPLPGNALRSHVTRACTAALGGKSFVALRGRRTRTRNYRALTLVARLIYSIFIRFFFFFFYDRIILDGDLIDLFFLFFTLFERRQSRIGSSRSVVRSATSKGVDRFLFVGARPTRETDSSSP